VRGKREDFGMAEKDVAEAIQWKRARKGDQAR